MKQNTTQAAIVENGVVTSYGWLSNLFPQVGSWPSNGIPSQEWLDQNNVKLVRYEPTTEEFNPVTQYIDRSVEPYVSNNEVIKFVITNKSPETITEEAREKQLKALADKRWSVENGGITVNNIPVRTDLDHQTKLTSVKQAADLDPNLVINWKLGNGNWAQLDVATINALFVAVTNHIQNCFTNEKTLSDLIIAAEDPMSVNINVGWPE